MKFPSKGLYAITQTENRTSSDIIAAVTAALEGGANVIQYRDKYPKDALFLGRALLALCRDFNVPFIINDDIKLAEQLGADGVHLGKHDADIHLARQYLGEDVIIGVSCYNDVETALAMQAQGVDYVAFGRFFPSNSKPLAAPAHIETLVLAKKTLNIPIVAIGGILPSNAKVLIENGADVLAVIGGVFDSLNPAKAVRDYLGHFEQ